MLKAPYMEKFYSYNSKYIHNALALRDPQHDSLEIFARLCDVPVSYTHLTLPTKA